MLMDSKQISDLIKTIAWDESLHVGVRISDSAITELSKVPTGFKEVKIDIDEAKLKEAVVEILRNAKRMSDSIGPQEITQALEEGECHYLWFC